MVEYKDVLKDDPEAIKEFENLIPNYMTTCLKDDSF